MENHQHSDSSHDVSGAHVHLKHAGAKYIVLTAVFLVAAGLIWYIASLGKYSTSPAPTEKQTESEQVVTLPQNIGNSFNADIIGKDIDTAAENMKTVDPLENL